MTAPVECQNFPVDRLFGRLGRRRWGGDRAAICAASNPSTAGKKSPKKPFLSENSRFPPGGSLSPKIYEMQFFRE
jgi:hypothetical protein